MKNFLFISFLFPLLALGQTYPVKPAQIGGAPASGRIIVSGVGSVGSWSELKTVNGTSLIGTGNIIACPTCYYDAAALGTNKIGLFKINGTVDTINIVLPAAYTLPKASASVVGGIRVGSGLSISSDGTLSATVAGGTPGGTSGQMQFNNAGAFAGSSVYWNTAEDATTGSLFVDKRSGTSATDFAAMIVKGNSSVLGLINNSTPSSTSGVNVSMLQIGAPTAADQRFAFLTGGARTLVSPSGATNPQSYNSAEIGFYTSQAWTFGTAHGSHIRIYTTTNGASARTEKGRWENDGSLLIGTTTNALGAKLNVNGSIAGTFANKTTAATQFLVNDGGIIKHRTASEVLSDIGGSSGGGYFTLTGTDIYNSNTGKVFIGGTSGSHKLTVTSSVAGDGVRAISTAAPSTSSGGMFIGNVDADPTAANQRVGGLIVGATGGLTAGVVGYSSQAWTGSARGTYLSFETVADNSTTRSEKMRITSGGNVRIGVLDTDLTAPTTSGTKRMVTTDGNGQLSFEAIPSGGSGSLADGDYTDITVSGTGTVMNIKTGVVGANELASTGISAGTYNNPQVTFDADGRATAVSNGTANFGSAKILSDEDYTVLSTDGVLILPDPAAQRTLTLPAASTMPNKMIKIHVGSTATGEWLLSGGFVQRGSTNFTFDNFSNSGLVAGTDYTLVSTDVGGGTYRWIDVTTDN